MNESEKRSKEKGSHKKNSKSVGLNLLNKDNDFNVRISEPLKFE